MSNRTIRSTQGFLVRRRVWFHAGHSREDDLRVTPSPCPEAGSRPLSLWCTSISSVGRLLVVLTINMQFTPTGAKGQGPTRGSNDVSKSRHVCAIGSTWSRHGWWESGVCLGPPQSTWVLRCARYAMLQAWAILDSCQPVVSISINPVD